MSSSGFSGGIYASDYGSIITSPLISPSSFATLTWSDSAYTTPEVKVDKEVEAKANEILKAEFAAQLASYPTVEWSSDSRNEAYMYAYCPKCGREISCITLIPASDKQPEHLSWACHCGYRLLTKTRDAQ